MKSLPIIHCSFADITVMLATIAVIYLRSRGAERSKLSHLEVDEAHICLHILRMGSQPPQPGLCKVQAAERDSQGSAVAAKAAAAAQAAAEQQLKQCHAAHVALEKYAKAAEREAERLEAAAEGASAAHGTTQQELQECRAALAPLQQKALDQERLLDAISGKGENCLNTLQAAMVSPYGT